MQIRNGRKCGKVVLSEVVAKVVGLIDESLHPPSISFVRHLNLSTQLVWGSAVRDSPVGSGDRDEGCRSADGDTPEIDGDGLAHSRITGERLIASVRIAESAITIFHSGGY